MKFKCHINSARGRMITATMGLVCAWGIIIAPCFAGVVTSVADSGPGTLRQEILDANADGVPTQITFDPSVFPAAISLASRLPAIRGEGDSIDTSGLEVVIDGAAVADAQNQRAIGVRINASSVTVTGLTIQNFANDGIYVGPTSTASGVSITRVMVSQNNVNENFDGIHISGGAGPNNLVEATIAGNQLNVNQDDGIVVEGSQGRSPGNNDVHVVIQDNRIIGSLGVASSGTITGDGIRVLGGNRNGSHNRIIANISGNHCLENIDDGIVVAGAGGGAASDNSIEATILNNVVMDNGADTSIRGVGLVVRGGSRSGAITPGNDNTIRFEMSGNRSMGNKSTGLVVSGGLGSGNSLQGSVSSNLGWRNGVDGIRISGGIGANNLLVSTVVESNRLVGNARDGINVNGGSGMYSVVQDVLLADNRVFQNGRFGLLVAPGTGSGNSVNIGQISGNLAIRNTRDGLSIMNGILGAGDTAVSANRSIRNAEDGIDIDSTGYLLTDNRALYNNQDGINAIGNSDGGGNIAVGNAACNTPGCY